MLKTTNWCGLLLCVIAGVASAQTLPTPLGNASATSSAPTSAAAMPSASPSPAEQRARWDALTPAQQAELRARYAAWKGLTATDQLVLRKARERLQTLPEDQQRALRTQFNAMDRLHRDGWRLGSQVGTYYAQLQPLIGYVLPAQRAPMLAALRGLDPSQLEQLAELAQRTPPQERDDLREAFLAEAPARRGAWLKHQLAR